MTIPAKAPVRVVARKEVAILLHNVSSESVVNADAGTVEHHFTLPLVPADTSYDCHMTLTLPAVRLVHTELLLESPDQAGQLPSWQHVVRGSMAADLVLAHICHM